MFLFERTRIFIVNLQVFYSFHFRLKNIIWHGKEPAPVDGESHSVLDTVLVPKDKAVIVFVFPKTRQQAFSLPRKAVPSISISGPSTAREILWKIHNKLKEKISPKALKLFPKEKKEEVADSHWCDLLADMQAFDGFSEELANSGEYDVKYVSIK